MSLRFGHTNNVTLLIDGNKEQGTDYLIGIIAASIAMFGFFLIWLVNLVVLKCLGPKRVGFFSGSMVKLPRAPKPPKEEVQAILEKLKSSFDSFLYQFFVFTSQVVPRMRHHSFCLIT